METVQRIRELKSEMAEKLDSAETWMMGCDSWKEANECGERIIKYKKFISYLDEMEKWFTR